MNGDERVVAALQDLVIAIVLGLGLGLVMSQVVVSMLGIVCVVKLFSIINAAEKQAT